jgi:RNA polymerase sigma-70 factor (ECF subfamily)
MNRDLTKEVFKELFEKHFDSVRSYVFYRSGNSELATDIAQETFLRIWEKQMQPDDKNTKGLLFKIAGDIFVSRYRKEKVAMNFSMTFKPDAIENSPEDQMQYQELKNRYEQALKMLPDNQRTVFLMSRMDGLRYHEIAGQLGLSVKAVEKRMNHALSFFKKFIEN